MPETKNMARYVKAWEKIPELKDWIAPVAGDETKVFCRVCQRHLHPNKKDLLVHANTRKHFVNAAKAMSYNEKSLPNSTQSLGSSFTTIKCEQINDSIIEEVSTFENKPENRNVTIEVFPSASIGQHDDLDPEEYEIVTEDISANKVLTKDSKQWAQFKDWLDDLNGKYYCTVCNKSLKSRTSDVLKHSLLKSHQFQCLKKGFNFKIAKKYAKGHLEASYIQNNPEAGSEKVLDLRTDLVTQPSKEMWNAMKNAKLDDDTYLEDTNVIELQAKVATLLEKEAALFFPTGTMANLVAGNGSVFPQTLAKIERKFVK